MIRRHADRRPRPHGGVRGQGRADRVGGAVLSLLCSLIGMFWSWVFISETADALGSGEVWGVVVGATLYTVLFALWALAITCLVRNQTGALALVLLVPLVVENVLRIILQVLSTLGDNNLDEIAKVFPFDAGAQMFVAPGWPRHSTRCWGTSRCRAWAAGSSCSASSPPCSQPPTRCSSAAMRERRRLGQRLAALVRRPVLRPKAEPARFSYTPVADGRPDPGEVVWAWVAFEDDPAQGKDRPVLVLGREGGSLLGLMLSSKDHDRDAGAEARAGPLLAGHRHRQVGRAGTGQRGPAGPAAAPGPGGGAARGSRPGPARFDCVVAAATPHLS
jgi:hypothetical protein